MFSTNFAEPIGHPNPKSINKSLYIKIGSKQFIELTVQPIKLQKFQRKKEENLSEIDQAKITQLLHKSLIPQKKKKNKLIYLTSSKLKSFLLQKMGFPASSMVKNLPSRKDLQETQVCSLGWDDPLEEDMATHSSILAWRIPWTEEPGGLQSMGSQRVGHDLAVKQFVKGFSSIIHKELPELNYKENIQ